MRTLAPIVLALVTSGCWTPGPGQLDPTRYPWDQPRRPGSYCIVSLELGSANGITVGGGQEVQLGCDPLQANPSSPGPIEAKGLVPPL